MDSNQEARTQLLRLRDLTAKTGSLHQLQIDHLTSWSGIVFGPKKWTTKIDIEKKTVYVDISKRKGTPKLQKAMIVMNEWVHWLLGPDWALEANSSPSFKGDRVYDDVNAARQAKLKQQKQ